MNLVALRGLRGADEQETQAIRKYLLGLALWAATADMELFLREGCLLRYAEEGDSWYQVPRRGDVTQVHFDRASIQEYLNDAARHFRSKWPEVFKERWPTLKYEFDLKKAKELLAKKTAEEGSEQE